jgi:hypothetical protein
VLRILTVLFIWLALSAIWPDQKRQVTWIALLFAIYPLFKLQPIAVVDSLHWFGYFCYAVSLWAMVQYVRNPCHYCIYTLLSILTGSAHLFFIEYFAGIELIRPVILWMVIPDRINTTKEHLRKVLKLWSLYLIKYLAFFIYRFYLIPRPETRFERNPPTMVIDLLNSPISTLPRLLEGNLKDLVEILYSAWSKIISPVIVEVTRSANFKSILIALLVGFGLLIYLSKYLRAAITAGSVSNTTSSQ